jgi:hypothetical protein
MVGRNKVAAFRYSTGSFGYLRAQNLVSRQADIHLASFPVGFGDDNWLRLFSSVPVELEDNPQKQLHHQRQLVLTSPDLANTSLPPP